MNSREHPSHRTPSGPSFRWVGAKLGAVEAELARVIPKRTRERSHLLHVTRGVWCISINESTHCCRMCMHVQEDANVTARTMCVGLGQHAHRVNCWGCPRGRCGPHAIKIKADRVDAVVATATSRIALAAGSSDNKNRRSPCITKEAGVSPGWTRAETNRYINGGNVASTEPVPSLLMLGFAEPRAPQNDRESSVEGSMEGARVKSCRDVLFAAAPTAIFSAMRLLISRSCISSTARLAGEEMVMRSKRRAWMVRVSRRRR
mmetsp:Transcript_8008/g.24058  ORF Transcript_8008/g.24058 Transcript_8008/m.24058 type:complete len:261 (+) Transcript_8008:754-1536(+)